MTDLRVGGVFVEVLNRRQVALRAGGVFVEVLRAPGVFPSFPGPPSPTLPPLFPSAALSPSVLLGWPFRKEVSFGSRAQRAISGKELRALDQPLPIWRWTLRYPV